MGHRAPRPRRRTRPGRHAGWSGSWRWPVHRVPRLAAVQPPRSVSRSELADDPDHLALDLELGGVDGWKFWVGGLEADAALLAVEALQGDPVVLQESHPDVPVVGRGLGLGPPE